MKKICLFSFSFLLSFMIVAQNNIGINIPVPEFTLDIRSLDENSSSFLNLGNSSNSQFLQFHSGNDQNPQPYIMWHTDAPLRFGVEKDGLEKMARFSPEGNFGIGTETPVERLDVHGNMAISGEVRPDGVRGNEGQILQSDGSSGMEWADICNYQHFKGFAVSTVELYA